MGAPVINDNQYAETESLEVSEGKEELFYSDAVYTPEALFSAWLNLSFFSVTTALLFYHMTQSKSIEADPRVAAFLAISLMVISCAYVFYSVGPYLNRMEHVAKKCRVLKECSDEQVASIISHKRIYQTIGYGTIIIEILIAGLILYKTRKVF